MKRSNIDAMICKQEGITEITRDEIHRIQLEKLNIVLKREKEREGFYRDLPERLESLMDLRSLPFTTRCDSAKCGCFLWEKFRTDLISLFSRYSARRKNFRYQPCISSRKKRRIVPSVWGGFLLSSRRYSLFSY